MKQTLLSNPCWYEKKLEESQRLNRLFRLFANSVGHLNIRGQSEDI